MTILSFETLRVGHNRVYLSEVSKGRDNNLNLIRMIAALSVLVSHAWPLSQGSGAIQPLERLLDFQLGTLAVYVFFAISGFLVTRSLESQPSEWHWLLARALRIFPGLAVALLLTVLVLGPLVTSLPLGVYFSEPATYSYFINNLLLAFRQSGLPGVFEGSPFGGEVNGSLWTLLYEVLGYGAVLLMGLGGALRSSRVLMAFALVWLAFLGAVTVLPIEPSLLVWGIVSLGLPFSCGIAFYMLRNRLVLSPWIALALAVGAYLLRDLPLYRYALVLALTYGVFVLAYLPRGPIRRYNALGDYSYGVYIYAWPMQQLAVHAFGPMEPIQNILIAVPMVLAMAWLSWTFVEKPALGLLRRANRGRSDGGALGRQGRPDPGRERR